MAFDLTDILTGTGIGATVVGFAARNLYTRFVELEKQVNELKNAHELMAQKIDLNQYHIREKLEDISEELTSFKDDIRKILIK